MTINETKQRIRELGLTCRYDSSTGEFRVNLRPRDGGTEDTAYYTDDRQDAVGTAEAMAVGLPGRIPRQTRQGMANYLLEVL